DYYCYSRDGSGNALF
nr:immunoglobulin light chain junction region [Macaca mulatta]